MAGSPSAAETEASISQLDIVNQKKGKLYILRIDPDEFRSNFEEYTGNYAWVFQPAASILMAVILDIALKQNQSFVIDGTLSNFECNYLPLTQADEFLGRVLTDSDFISTA